MRFCTVRLTVDDIQATRFMPPTAKREARLHVCILAARNSNSPMPFVLPTINPSDVHPVAFLLCRLHARNLHRGGELMRGKGQYGM